MNGIEGGANGQRLRMFVSLHVIARQNHSIVAFSIILTCATQLLAVVCEGFNLEPMGRGKKKKLKCLALDPSSSQYHFLDVGCMFGDHIYETCHAPIAMLRGTDCRCGT